MSASRFAVAGSSNTTVSTPANALSSASARAPLTLAGAGIPVSGTGGAAVSGARALADEGAFAGGETVVLLDPATANREADILRSHLMKQGI